MILERKLFSDVLFGHLDFSAISRSGNRIDLKVNKGGIIGKFLGKISKRLREEQGKSTNLDVYVNNENVGEVQLYSKPNNQELNVVWIEIFDEYNGNGYSQSVLETIIKLAKEKGFKKITLEVPGISPNARHIYEKLGFKDSNPGKILGKRGDYWDGLTEMELIL